MDLVSVHILIFLSSNSRQARSAQKKYRQAASQQAFMHKLARPPAAPFFFYNVGCPTNACAIPACLGPSVCGKGELVPNRSYQDGFATLVGRRHDAAADLAHILATSKPPWIA